MDTVQGQDAHRRAEVRRRRSALPGGARLPVGPLRRGDARMGRGRLQARLPRHVQGLRRQRSRRSDRLEGDGHARRRGGDGTAGPRGARFAPEDQGGCADRVSSALHGPGHPAVRQPDARGGLSRRHVGQSHGDRGAAPHVPRHGRPFRHARVGRAARDGGGRRASGSKRDLRRRPVLARVRRPARRAPQDARALGEVLARPPRGAAVRPLCRAPSRGQLHDAGGRDGTRARRRRLRGRNRRARARRRQGRLHPQRDAGGGARRGCRDGVRGGGLRHVRRPAGRPAGAARPA